MPLGLNEMAVPRISIVASFATIAMLFASTIWLALAASSFLSQFEDAFAAVNEEDIQVDGRWTWETTLLFEGNAVSPTRRGFASHGTYDLSTKIYEVFV